MAKLKAHDRAMVRRLTKRLTTLRKAGEVRYHQGLVDELLDLLGGLDGPDMSGELSEIRDAAFRVTEAADDFEKKWDDR